MNLRLKLSCLGSNRGIFFLQPFPHRCRILFVRSSHRLLRGQTPGPQIASHRPHRNLHLELSRQQLLHRFSGPQRKGQAQLVRATAENVAHRRGCLVRCQSRNRRSSTPLRFQRPSSFPFHHPHPAAHCTSSYPENSSHLSLRKTFLNGLNDSPAKIFLSFRRHKHILKAVEPMEDVQVVLSVGKNISPENLGHIPSNTIVVRSAPQIELLKRAALCITHAGLNTVLESLAHGVPMVAIPIGYDQPGTAARIKHHGTGEFIELEQLTTHRLRGLIEKVLHDPSYRERARYFQKVISKTRGLDVAADIIEQAFQKYQTEVPRAVF